MNISVIGAGIGGLAAACLLRKRGHQVTVFEKNDRPGGKMDQIEAGGYRFDTGPSLFTMPYLLEDLFSRCGAELNNYLQYKPLRPLCRYFYRDGTTFDNYSERADTLKELERIAPEDLNAYIHFLEYSACLYDKTADAFIFNPLYAFSDFRKLPVLDFLNIDAFSTVSDKVDEYFSSPYLRRFFKRFTTYNGSSPFKAPATLNVIPHVEINQGGYYVEGGMYRIAEALFALAEKLGVDFRFGSEVTSISLTKDRNQVSGLQTTAEDHPSDLIFANSDVAETIQRLLPPESVKFSEKLKTEKTEPSCSGFVLLLGINRRYKQLNHHNIFFSSDYEQEFNDIFERKIMPEDPTIYIADTSSADPDHAPPGHSNLFILINAPYISDSYDWESESPAYAEFVINELEKRGLEELSGHIEYKQVIHPADFYRKYRSNKGSIYGTSSNNMFSAFLRPRNKSKSVEGLYYTGGSAHPGGGIPLVIQSAFNALELAERYEDDL